jgi:uncharacterized protein (TIGR04255 family)
MLAINAFGFSTYVYRDFRTFNDEFSSLLSTFRQRTSLTPTRFGLRYVNALPPDTFHPRRAGGALHHFLKIRIEGTEVLGESVGQNQLVLETGKNDLRLRTAVYRPAVSPDSGGISLEPGVRLDFDCYSDSPGNMDQVLDLLERAHALVDEAFFSLITDEYLSFLKGEA